jgi:TonB family protein
MAGFRQSFLCAVFALLPFAGAVGQSARDEPIRAECDGAAISLYPQPGTHVMPPYPVISHRMSEQGETVLRLGIGADGRVQEGMVLRSSGSRRLDDAALDFVRTYWRWQGAFSCRTAVTEVTIAWRIIEPRP